MNASKKPFLIYRRTNIPWARAIFQNLTQHGYDVFFDYSGIASRDFERIILGNITAHAHFLVLLTPSALERCDDPANWLWREIETALANQRCRPDVPSFASASVQVWHSVNRHASESAAPQEVGPRGALL
jgi:hypothetical protein